MLSQLTISNFAIVRELEIDFQRGMTAITGETGRVNPSPSTRWVFVWVVVPKQIWYVREHHERISVHVSP